MLQADDESLDSRRHVIYFRSQYTELEKMPRLPYVYTQAKPCVRSAAPPPLLRRFPSIALWTDADGRTFNEIGPQPSARNKVLTLKTSGCRAESLTGRALSEKAEKESVSWQGKSPSGDYNIPAEG